MKIYNIGIIGAGNIANAMAAAINGLGDGVCAYAIAARSIDRAEVFAKKWGFKKAYGSYDEIVKDPMVDLIYVATPHSHHFEHAMLCIENGKPCLVEKAFTANASQAKILISEADERNVFITEAIWTRYLPAREIINNIIESGVLGEVHSLYAEFSVDLRHIERMWNPNLAGGALLDLGMYALTFASMYFGNEIVKVESSCSKYETGVDDTSDIYYTYKDGKTAHLRTSMTSGPVNEGIIYGSKGKLVVDNLNNYSSIIRYDLNDNDIEEYAIPKQINGYEYELLAALNAISESKTECEEMPHAESVKIMEQMDYLRNEWGVIYPFEKR